jgi:ABC-2 type transport system ATP-binding protein
MNSIITVENVTKVYKKNLRTLHALKNLSFKVEKNRILGILGPNGAGKTTLLKIITGIITPDKNSGSVRLFGMNNLDAVKHRLGFLPENPEFFKNISALELLEFTLKISGTSFQRDRIDNLLKRINLYRERNERVRNFSKGMRQRLGIAQAILHSPELLILDEPMSGLDPPGRRMVIDIIASYHREGKTILFSTHHLEDIEALCTDVMVIANGQILLEKSLAQLREKSRFKIETEDQNGKTTSRAGDAAELWDLLEAVKRRGTTLIKVQSDIAEQLEAFYSEDQTHENHPG